MFLGGGSRRIEEKAPRDTHPAAYSGVGAVLNGFQMRSLETIISASQRNGRGPDSSLKRLWIFVRSRVL